jgi:hypothetical protein
MAKNEIMNVTETIGTFDNIVGNRTFWTSFDATTIEAKKKLLNAMNKSDYNINEIINGDIEIKDVMLTGVNLTNDETGEVTAHPLVTLFAPDGTTYASTSDGVFNSIKKIMMVFGLPTEWEEPIKVKVRQIKTKRGQTFTLEVL